MKRSLKAALGIALLMFSFASCKKNDLETDTNINKEKQLNDRAIWKTSNVDTSLMVYSINDKQVTSEIITEGLILAYKKDQGTIKTLPVSSQGNSWFSMASPGRIDIYQSFAGQPDLSDEFMYLIIHPEQLRKLNQNGTIDFQKLNFEEMKSLLKNQ